MYQKIKETWADIPGKWILVVLAIVYILFIITGGQLDSFPPTVGLMFVLPALNILSILYILYLFIYCMKSRMHIPYGFSFVVFIAVQWLLFESFSYGFDIDLWQEFNTALFYVVIVVGVIGYVIKIKSFLNGFIFMILLTGFLWTFPAGKDFLSIVITDRTIWENKNIKIRVSEKETLQLSIPRRYFNGGWFYKANDFYHLVFSYPDMQPALGSKKTKKTFTVYLFTNSLDLSEKLYLYKPKDFSQRRNIAIFNELEYDPKYPTTGFVAKNKEKYPLYFLCGAQMGIDRLEDVFSSETGPLCTRNPLYAKGLQYRYWLSGKDLLIWKKIEDKVRAKIESFIVNNKDER